MSSEITFQNFPELLLDEINRSKISSITSEKILRISAHYFMLLRKMTVELTFENFYLMRSTGLIFLRSPDVRHRHTDTHTQSYRRKDAQTHRCAQTHRHTGTQTHRHTGTQTHRHTRQVKWIHGKGSENVRAVLKVLRRFRRGGCTLIRWWDEEEDEESYVTESICN